MAGFFPDNRKERPTMSHFNIDRSPPRVRAPDHEAIQRLDDQLTEQRRFARRQRSLHTCHRPAVVAPTLQYRSNTGAYVPQFSARLLNDPRLSDGARRCAAKLLEISYRKDREGRTFKGTVLYLAKCLHRSERAVQTYLAQLRAGGYIRHQVIRSERARMCVGIFITLLEPLFPRHHTHEWPVKLAKSGVKKDSQNYTPNILKKEFQGLLDVQHWSMLCMDGVLRALMKSLPPVRAHSPAGR
jgi:hypothetical protein